MTDPTAPDGATPAPLAAPETDKRVIVRGRIHQWPADEDGPADWEWFDRNIPCDSGCVDAVILSEADYQSLLRAAAPGAAAVPPVQEPVAVRYSSNTAARWRYLNFPFTKGWTFPPNLGTPEPLYTTPTAAESAAVRELVTALKQARHGLAARGCVDAQLDALLAKYKATADQAVQEPK